MSEWGHTEIFLCYANGTTLPINCLTDTDYIHSLGQGWYECIFMHNSIPELSSSVKVCRSRRFLVVLTYPPEEDACKKTWDIQYRLPKEYRMVLRLVHVWNNEYTTHILISNHPENLHHSYHVLRTQGMLVPVPFIYLVVVPCIRIYPKSNSKIVFSKFSSWVI